MVIPSTDTSRNRTAPRFPRTRISYGTGTLCDTNRFNGNGAFVEDLEDDAKDSDEILQKRARQLHSHTRRNVVCIFIIIVGFVALLLVSNVNHESHPHLRPTSGYANRLELLTRLLRQLPDLPMLEKRVSVNGELNTTLIVAEKLVHNGPIAFYTRAYENSIPGPLLVVKAGDVLNIHLVNKLGPNVIGVWAANTMHKPNNTNLHFHGMHVDPKGKEDNVFRIVPPGESADIQLHVPWNHPRGLFHYHPHVHGSVFLQMGGGMVGPIVVEDDPTTVPSEFSAIRQKHVVVLQEFKFTGGIMTSLVEAAQASRSTLNMQLTYTAKTKLGAQVKALYPDVHESERPIRKATLSKDLLDEITMNDKKPNYPPMAQYFAVNGEYLPKIQIHPDENVLLRILHAGGIASLEIQIPGCSIILAASDGLYLPKPRVRKTVILSPGARVDLVINCARTEDGHEFLRPIQSVKDPDLHFFMGNHSDFYSGVLAFLYVHGESRNESLVTMVPPPSQLYGPSKSLLALSGKDHREMDIVPFEFEFTMGDPILKDDYYYKPCYVNHELFTGQSIRNLTLDRVQEWVITNKRNENGDVSLKNHPFHLHTNAFQIVNMSHGHGVDYEIGDWRDVISIPTPGDVTIRFRPEDFTGFVAAHCHILGHSDAGMIAGFDIIPNDSN
ncbi:multicopper oxidase [Plasmopara halstedii]|uniref:Multicopper oxidase n=1 Tax=Plasmopara halstedii TaxID=4781 RepID=A0A0P1ADX2_PLAHL|nr:multicopper oxidase [Plasmopara halstedii]CEG38917.1 multicopper oxidase [Plasmopara halstedii]|eukprot:XP_024575286.1 multicopper oxidase [Plasmopara halstedii]